MSITKPEGDKENAWPWQQPRKAQDLKTESHGILTKGGLYISFLSSHEYTTYLGNFGPADSLFSSLLVNVPWISNAQLRAGLLHEALLTS